MDRMWQFPFRAVAMPHHWLHWLWRTGQLTRGLVVEYLLTYAGYFAIYAGIIAIVGVERFLLGLLPAAVLHSFLLWYPFAIKTHEGYSVGEAVERSHNYRGRLAFFFSFGLSLHRAHHLWPQLGWLQMLPLVEPCTWKEALTFRRDIQLEL
jgi:fatty acid desaturase